jgi:hypothetical protein
MRIYGDTDTLLNNTTTEPDGPFSATQFSWREPDQDGWRGTRE